MVSHIHLAVDDEIKERLDEEKGDDDTWEDLMKRGVLEEE